MSSAPRLAKKKQAEGCAALVLRELKIETLPVDPRDIAAHKDITVQANPSLHDGVSGTLVKAGDEFGIMYSTKISSEGFQNFSIAHEIGHYSIDGHCDALLKTGEHFSRAGFASADPFEQEADYFAAALLMPELPFRKEINKHETGLASIEALSKKCKTSLTATAIRYSNLTRDAVAVILSTGPAIDFCFMSDALKDAKGITWLKKGTPLPVGTLTEEFNKSAANVRQGKKEKANGLLNDWMDGNEGYPVIEEVIGLGSYGRTLTVLNCTKLSCDRSPEIDDDDEEELVRSWTPKFSYGR